MTVSVLGIPRSVQAEHNELHATLVRATARPGPVGAAARELARVLHPHFLREERLALPSLGLLAPLAAGEWPDEVIEAAALTGALERELQQMLAEHLIIHSAIEALREAVREAGEPEFERFADQLVHHARSEEEVLYPAALLVGRYIRCQLDRQREGAAAPGGM